MNETVLKTPKTAKSLTLKTPLILLGFAFILMGLFITFGIAYAGYTFVQQPDQITKIFTQISTEDNLFIKWAINGQADQIELSHIIAFIVLAVAIAIIIKVIIAFITMCISSGKGLLNLSRNFDD